MKHEREKLDKMGRKVKERIKEGKESWLKKTVGKRSKATAGTQKVKKRSYKNVINFKNLKKVKREQKRGKKLAKENYA